MENTEKSRVVLVPCGDYDEEKVYQAVKAGVSLLGGMAAFAKPEEKILVKPNFLSVSTAESAVVTHPAVIRAVLRLLSEAGCTKVKYGDSPAHGSSKAAAEKIGLRPENTCGAELAPMDKEVKTEWRNGDTQRTFLFTEEAVSAEGIINVCKMKTHALQGLTGAVKNTFGLIAGMNKAACHVKYPDPGDFARYLVDIQLYKRPRLHIMDGIVAMEGNGPGSGDPVKVGVLLLSSDPVALDTVFALLVGANPARIPTIVQGAAEGLGKKEESEIELLVTESGGAGVGKAAGTAVTFAEAFSLYGKPDFKMERSNVFRFGADVLKALGRFGRRPYIQEEKCVRCGVCVSHCPVEGGAVTFKNGKDHIPVYDYKKCVRCYCCQEICPQKAIGVKKGLLG